MGIAARLLMTMQGRDDMPSTASVSLPDDQQLPKRRHLCKVSPKRFACAGLQPPIERLYWCCGYGIVLCAGGWKSCGVTMPRLKNSSAVSSRAGLGFGLLRNDIRVQSPSGKVLTRRDPGFLQWRELLIGGACERAENEKGKVIDYDKSSRVSYRKNRNAHKEFPF